MKLTMIGVALSALLATVALADPPKPLHVSETVTINATPKQVWEAIKDFDGLAKWHPGFASDEIVSGGNNKVGTVRKLTIKDGPSFTEKLTSFDDAAHSFSYIIVESPLPITDYKSSVVVAGGKKPGTANVVWSGTFKRKNPADNPPEAESDAGVKKLVRGVYRGGLDNLKKTLDAAAH
jgi:mxaD protein